MRQFHRQGKEVAKPFVTFSLSGNNTLTDKKKIPQVYQQHHE
jgi:hypothetical protein